MDETATGVAGWLFLLAVAMVWIGRTLLPVRVGPFIEPTDFGRVHERLRTWIWLYRLHLFGLVIAVMAFVALATLSAAAAERVVVWPAVAVLAMGLIVTTLAEAYYYHFGAWGAIDMEGKSSAAVVAFADSLKPSTEYVTCLTRFGRVFFGLGQVTLAVGIVLGGLLPMWLAVAGALLGIAAMALTMAFGDDLQYYEPVFHLNAAWLVGIGVVLLRSGSTAG